MYEGDKMRDEQVKRVEEELDAQTGMGGEKEAKHGFAGHRELE